MSDTGTAEKLYRLLPAFYRVRDAEQGEPLKALLSVIAGQVDIIDQDISRLYRSWFIETCDEWVVPYIGELLGVRGVHPVSESTYSLRAFVANTLRYRRRKGTATMLEQLAGDVTGWGARAVEFFQLLGTTQYINHLRPHNLRTPDFRDGNALELLDTPFDTIGHTVDVRRIKSGGGKHNIPNIGLFLWRLQAFPMVRATAYSHNNGKFSFSPLGDDIPLFNHPETEEEITHLAEEVNVPTPIRRRVFLENKESYYDEEQGIFIWVDGNEIPAANIICCNLEEWEHRPPATPPGIIAVDPVLGRMTFPPGVKPKRGTVEVSYYYGFSSEVAGGCYNRDCQPISKDFKVYKIGRDETFDNITNAISQWTNEGKQDAVLLIKDSRTYDMGSPNITIPAGKTLEIRADDETFPLLRLRNFFMVTGKTGSKLILSGLCIYGDSISIQNGDLSGLELKHCTLVPGLYFKRVKEEAQPAKPNLPSLTALQGNTDLNVSIERSICGGIELLDTHDLEIDESIVQGLLAKAVNGPNLTVESSTIMGEVVVRQVELASNTIFTGIVTAKLKQKGCVRFSYVPGGSQVPRRHRCQPDLAIKKEIEAAQKIQSPLPEVEKERIIKNIRAWLRPVFTDERYHTPGYAQLGLNCPKEIYEGAEDGAEMGVFRHLQQPQREANLRAGLEEYLPANMEAGIFFIN
jgi:hypothetical protein